MGVIHFIEVPEYFDEAAYMGYAASRTVGMPGVSVKDWLDPIGVLSVIVEIGYVLLALKVLLRPHAAQPN